MDYRSLKIYDSANWVMVARIAVDDFSLFHLRWTRDEHVVDVLTLDGVVPVVETIPFPVLHNQSEIRHILKTSSIMEIGRNIHRVEVPTEDHRLTESNMAVDVICYQVLTLLALLVGNLCLTIRGPGGLVLKMERVEPDHLLTFPVKELHEARVAVLEDGDLGEFRVGPGGEKELTSIEELEERRPPEDWDPLMERIIEELVFPGKVASPAPIGELLDDVSSLPMGREGGALLKTHEIEAHFDGLDHCGSTLLPGLLSLVGPVISRDEHIVAAYSQRGPLQELVPIGVLARGCLRLTISKA